MPAIATPGHLAARPAVGVQVMARHLTIGDEFLVEEHLVGSEIVGAGREVLALVTFSYPENAGRWQVVEWAGAGPGTCHTTGTTIYERGSRVTLLAPAGGWAA
jgi:hypothetical protein